ncbi:ABC transporter ATP-binding protein [Anaerocolumna cellulosilytica]|uniref:ABC transporter ATP-binding protein n=1 Tax=Anaerocolumna cellulosilytica TaxID=433286 RepID=A0A6S6R368_9FIRM|nr:ATP-binding cassette domain-containing protein [Anaerocolumna cellulosilytica]MBB5196690.1 ATPase subunit of ABC transporter with duplicated ATPase domains [Anaerocolumna cellulosilytica]BCJ93952.1 ABC transporter ATP-binding protein [Anaerocolumna cellulosilytica]
MHEISLEGVKKYLDSVLILKNVTFLVTEGEKVAIVGENGCGKSTILKLIAGILKLHHCAGYPYAPIPPGFDEGWVKVSKDTVCAYLEQIPQYGSRLKVIDVLNLSFKEVHDLEAKLHQMEQSMVYLTGKDLKTALEKYGELVQLYELKGGYSIEEKISKICKGLNFTDSFLQQDFDQLSGGEKTTVALGKLLIDAPDVLLLDEPTNHLDIESVEWLEEYVKSYKGIVIVVSHDRYFLDNTVNKVIEIEDKVSHVYFGNYSEYIRQKEENIRLQYNRYKEQKKKISSMEQSVKELKEWAKKADNNKFVKRAASIQNKLDKLTPLNKPVVNRQNLKLTMNEGERSGKIVIKALNLSKVFENKTILQQAEVLVQYGERIALVGPNGCGKTTFLRMLLGELQPDEGILTLGAGVRSAYLPQNLIFEDEELTVLDYFREDTVVSEGQARDRLAKYKFYGGNVYKKIKLLSGGEKVRLKLCKLLFQELNLIILDEPTNHLDMISIESIEAALSEFKGTIFLISHDRYFINKMSQRILAIEDYSIKSYLGNYDDYRLQRERAENGQEKKEQPVQEKIIKTIDVKKSEKANFKKKQPLEKGKADSKKREEKIELLEKQLKELDKDIEKDTSDYERLSKLYQVKKELTDEIDALLEEWIDDPFCTQ